MKMTALVAIIASLACASVAFGAHLQDDREPEVEATKHVSGRIANLAWTQSNIETLRSFDKTAILKFLNESAGVEGTPDAIKAWEVDEFEWVDLAGDGRYELATVGSSGPCCYYLYLYWQVAPKKVRSQSYGGAGKLSDTIRDLNGDGKKELILDAYVGSESYMGTKLQAMWPQVYASRMANMWRRAATFPTSMTTKSFRRSIRRSVTTKRRATKKPLRS